MPDRGKIQEFARELKRLGNEPEILRKRGEPVEEEPVARTPSAAATPRSGRESASAAGGPAPSDASAGTPPPLPEDDFSGDIDSLLAGLGEELDEPDEGSPAEQAERSAPEEPPAEPDSPDDAFLDDFLRQSDEADVDQMTSIFDDSDEEQEGATGSAGSDALDEPTLSDDESDAGEAAAGATSAGAAVDAEDDLSDLGDFGDLGDLGDFGEQSESGAGPAGTGDAAVPDDAFDLDTDALDTTSAENQGAGLEGDEILDESLFFDVPPIETLEPTPAEPTPGGPDETGERPDDLGDFDDIPIPDEDEGFGETTVPDEEPTVEETVAEPFDEDFGVPGLVDEDFKEPPGAGTGDDAESEPFNFDEPAADGDFSMDEPEPGEEPTDFGDDLSGFEEIVEPGTSQPSDDFADEAPSQTTSVPAAAPASGEDFGDLGDLGDISEQFGLSGGEESGDSEEDLNPALAVGEAAAPRPPRGAAPSRPSIPTGGGEDLTLSNADFQALQRTLSAMPRNVRIAVEELIGEQNLGGPDLNRLIRLLVGGAGAAEVAEVAGRILGRKLEVPVQYEKRTGAEFEEERASFAYRFRHNILPILRAFLAGAAVLGLLVFLVFRFIYTPIHAYSIYSAGYRQLERNQYTQANDDFSRASRVWEMKNWYYRYADGYISKRQYAFAADKYDALLRLWPEDRKAIFDYSDMESKLLGDYAKAEQLLSSYLDDHADDFDTLLRAGDNYLRWGAEDSSKYELARRDYATLLQRYGTNNTVLFRMLQYFIRTDNYRQVMDLKDRFQADKSIKVDPEAYAELGGYLIDKKNLTDVRDILFRAMAVQRTLPEIHFNLARYFKAINNPDQEMVALQNALGYLEAAVPLSRERLAILIRTYDLYGENLYGRKQYLDAEQAYQKGISRYETALKQNQITPSPEVGRIYSDLADLNYYVSGNYDQALSLYQKAEQNKYTTPDLKYKEGYIYYRDQDYQNALLSFYNAAGNYSNNRSLEYATANTLFMRNDFFAAQGYYDNLLNSLEQQRSKISDFEPSTRVDDHALLVDLMKTYNNLGVTLNQIARRSSDASKYSRALVNLTNSMQSFDQLTRDPVTKAKPSSVDLAFVNMKNILYPVPNYELQIYNDLPRDLNDKEF